MKRLSTREEETIQFGEDLANDLTAGSVVALYGELGSGKTCFTKGICKGLGVKEEVTSPSFVFLNCYRGCFLVYHFDFFRLEKVEEAWDIGFEDFIYNDGVSVIEWAEKVQVLLPPKRIEVFFRRVDKGEKGKENLREIEIKQLG